MRLFLTLRCLLVCALFAGLNGCDQKRDFEKPHTRMKDGGMLAAVLFEGVVVCSEQRFDLDQRQRLDLPSNALQPSADTAEESSAKHFRLGKAGNVRELSWVHVKSTSEGDRYRFTLTHRLGEANESSETREIIYSGESMSLFEYGEESITLLASGGVPSMTDDPRGNQAGNR